MKVPKSTNKKQTVSQSRSSQESSSTKDSPYSVENLTGDSLIQKQDADAPNGNTGGGAGTTANAPDICQPIKDAIALDEKTTKDLGFTIVRPSELPERRKMLKMCEAVRDGNKKQIAATFGPALALMPTLGNIVIPSKAGPLLTDANAQQIFARLMELGETSKAVELYQKMESMVRSSYALDHRKQSRKLDYYTALMDRLRARVAAGDANSAMEDLKVIIAALPQMALGIEGMDYNFMRKMQEIDPIFTGLYAFDSRGREMAFFEAIWGYILELGTLAQTPLQRKIDALTTEMSGGVEEPPAAIDQLVTQLNEMAVHLEKIEADHKMPIADKTLDLTKTETTKSSRKHVDYFDSSDSQHAPLDINFFDSEQKTGPETKTTWRNVFKARFTQLSFLKEMFTKEGNRSVIGGMSGGKMNINSVESWREFTLAKYKALVAQGNSKEKAFEGAAKLLKHYLLAFTASTSYNVADFAPKGQQLQYLEESFPRGVTGQLIHDCGVYALRIAYILSGLESEMGIKIQFIILPAHVGLVISLNDMPIMITHNKSLIFVSSKDAQDRYDEWKTLNDSGEKVAGGGTNGLSKDQFKGELASQLFVHGAYGLMSDKKTSVNAGLDTPYQLVDFTVSGSNEADRKKALYQEWESIAKTPLFDTKTKDKDYQQFHLKYLDYIKASIRFQNDQVVPFWNGVCFQNWKTLAPVFEKYQGNAKAGAKLTLPSSKEEKEKIKENLKAFLDKTNPVFDTLIQNLTTLGEKAKAINDLITAKPAILAGNVKLAKGLRISQVIVESWVREYYNYLDEVKGKSAVDLVSPVPKDLSEFVSAHNDNPNKLLGEPPCTVYPLHIQPVPY